MQKYKIAFVVKNKKDLNIIKKQILEKGISNIDVLDKNEDISGYDIIKYDISPNKQFSEYLDLGQTASSFGFHTDPYDPPEKDLFNPEKSKKALEKAKQHLALDNLKVLIDSEEPEEFTRESFNIKMQELKDKIAQQEKEDANNLTIPDLMKMFHLAKEPISIITIGAQIMKKCYGRPISAKGYQYDYDPFWICEPWDKAFEEYPEKKSQWTKSLKTRIGNIIKQEKKYASLRFFIDFLVEKHIEESYSIIDEYRKEPEVKVPEINMEDIDLDEIPF